MYHGLLIGGSYSRSSENTAASVTVFEPASNATFLCAVGLCCMGTEVLDLDTVLRDTYQVD